MERGGYKSIKDHPFFKNINWETHLDPSNAPPCINFSKPSPAPASSDVSQTPPSSDRSKESGGKKNVTLSSDHDNDEKKIDDADEKKTCENEASDKTPPIAQQQNHS